jgi:FkbM family methyltransferase
MHARFKNLVEKAWEYTLASIERPSQFPRTLIHVLGGVHMREFLKMNRKWVSRAGISTVIDVGAHEGEFSSAIHAVLPGAKIYAFEPIPECCTAVSKRVGAKENLQTFPVAIGDRCGRATFWKSVSTKSSSFLPMSECHKKTFPWTAKSSEIEVDLRPLDSFLPEMELKSKVLLKLDVEGYEERALAGASAVLCQVDYVLLEVLFQELYEGQAEFGRIHCQLADSGFVYSGNMDQVLSPLDESIVIADVLFVKATH